MRYYLEKIMEVWNADTGEHIEVSEDPDGLGLVRMRYITDDGQEGPDIIWSPEASQLIIEAIINVSEHIRNRK